MPPSYVSNFVVTEHNLIEATAIQSLQCHYQFSPRTSIDTPVHVLLPVLKYLHFLQPNREYLLLVSYPLRLQINESAPLCHLGYPTH